MYPPIEYLRPTPSKVYKKNSSCPEAPKKVPRSLPHFKLAQLRGIRPRVCRKLLFSESRYQFPDAPKKSYPFRQPNNGLYTSTMRPTHCTKLNFEDDANEANKN